MNHIRIRVIFILTIMWGASPAPTADTEVPPATPPGASRHIATGLLIPDESYCDQPYIVITQDGNWLCTLTTGTKGEGSDAQHFVATISKDQGKTWGSLIDIEPATGPEASYGVPLIVPSGRVYAFYTYNGDQIQSLPGSARIIRADMLGWYCFRYSDDNGLTWSKRYRMPMRVTAADRGNQWQGQVQIFWGIDKPKTSDLGATFAFTKLGRYMLTNGEGWLMHSDNILTETDPTQLNWQLLPDGEHGIRAPEFGSVQEEHNHVFIGPAQMYMIYRTTTGYPCHTYSRDAGKTWSTPEHMTYSPNGRRIKNPRACPKIWRCENGKFLFWFHNHSSKGFGGRNPAWVSGGVIRDGRMHWSEPEILLYAPNPGIRMSYPDLIQQDGKYWVTETQKSEARVHAVDPVLIEGMWAQLEGKGEITTDGMLLDLQGEAARAASVKMPELPNLSAGGSFTIDLQIRFEDNTQPSQVVLDSRDAEGRGLAMEVDAGGLINVHFVDSAGMKGRWTSEPGLLKSGQTHYVTAIVDGGPNIITFVVDRKLCDGGDSRRYGWGRFDPKIRDINGSDTLRIAPSFDGEILGLRIYDRYLRTSEAVANHQANGEPSAAESE